MERIVRHGENTLIDAGPTIFHNEQIRKWCERKAEERYLIANCIVEILHQASI